MPDFPTSIPTGTRPVSTDPFNDGSATDATNVVDELWDELEAIAQKVGIDASANTTTVDYILENHAHTSGGDDGGAISHADLTSLTTGDPHTQYPLKSIATTKGDLWAATASAAISRLAVGTNGHVLTADSTQSTGIKWAAAGAGSADGFIPALVDFAIIYDVGNDVFDVYDGRAGTIVDADNTTWNTAMDYVKTQLGTDHTDPTNGGTVFFGANQAQATVPVDEMLDLYNCYGYELIGPGDGGGCVFQATNNAKMQGVDNVQTTLAEALDASENGVDITSASGVPAPATSGYFYVFVPAAGANTAEFMRCTARTTTTLTVDRGVRNQSAGVAHANGDTIHIGGWKFMMDARGAGRIRINGFKMDCNSVIGCGGIVQERRTVGPGGPHSFSLIDRIMVYNYEAPAYCQGDHMTALADEGTANTYWENCHAVEGTSPGITDEYGAFMMFQNDWHVFWPQVNNPNFMYGFLAYGGTGQLTGGHVATGDRAAVAFKDERGGTNTMMDGVYLDNIGGAADEPGILLEPPTGSHVSRLLISGCYANGVASNTAPFCLATTSGSSKIRQVIILGCIATGGGSDPLTAIFATNDAASINGLMLGGNTMVADTIVSSGVRYQKVGMNVANQSTGAATPDYITDSVQAVPSFSVSGTLTTQTGAHRWYNDTGQTVVIKEVRASVGTAPTGQAILCDVNVNGSTIWSTQANRVSIAAAGNTASQTTFNTTTLADGAYLTVDVDQIGSGTAGANLTVTIVLGL